VRKSGDNEPDILNNPAYENDDTRNEERVSNKSGVPDIAKIENGDGE